MILSRNFSWKSSYFKKHNTYFVLECNIYFEKYLKILLKQQLDWKKLKSLKIKKELIYNQNISQFTSLNFRILGETDVNLRGMTCLL